MNKLLSAGFTRLKKDKILWVAMGALLLYALLRVLLTPQVPFSCYVGPMVLLWPAAYLLLLLSYVADKLLWDD